MVNQVRYRFDSIVNNVEGLRSIWEKYFEETHAIIYVVDTSNQEKLQEGKATLDKILRYPDLKDVPLLILANKQDHRDSIKLDNVKDLFSNVTSSNRITEIFPISALEG